MKNQREREKKDKGEDIAVMERREWGRRDERRGEREREKVRNVVER